MKKFGGIVVLLCLGDVQCAMAPAQAVRQSTTSQQVEARPDRRVLTGDSASTEQPVSVSIPTQTVPGGIRPASPTSPPSPTAQQTTIQFSVQTVGGVLQPSREDPSTAIAYWEGRLQEAFQMLSVGVQECRTSCRANRDICAAAREICDLTGDGANQPARDVHCIRARESCEQATQQRSRACPTCPEEH